VILLPTWNAPYERDLFSTGRDEFLTRLNDSFRTAGTTALTQPQDIRGIGDIGKTQTVLEYTYIYHTEYEAIFWISFYMYKNLDSEFVRFAHKLNLPERGKEDQALIVEAVQR
jgi:hypothetical protein